MDISVPTWSGHLAILALLVFGIFVGAANCDEPAAKGDAAHRTRLLVFCIKDGPLEGAMRAAQELTVTGATDVNPEDLVDAVLARVTRKEPYTIGIGPEALPYVEALATLGAKHAPLLRQRILEKDSTHVNEPPIKPPVPGELFDDDVKRLVLLAALVRMKAVDPDLRAHLRAQVERGDVDPNLRAAYVVVLGATAEEADDAAKWTEEVRTNIAHCVDRFDTAGYSLAEKTSLMLLFVGSYPDHANVLAPELARLLRDGAIWIPSMALTAVGHDSGEAAEAVDDARRRLMEESLTAAIPLTLLNARFRPAETHELLQRLQQSYSETDISVPGAIWSLFRFGVAPFISDQVITELGHMLHSDDIEKQNFALLMLYGAGPKAHSVVKDVLRLAPARELRSDSEVTLRAIGLVEDVPAIRSAGFDRAAERIRSGWRKGVGF